jgi:hypothetical protein
LFDLSTKKVFTSHNVRFHEKVFHYASVKPNPALSPSHIDCSPIPLMTHDTTSSLDSSPNTSHPTRSPPANSPASPFSKPPPTLASSPSSILCTYMCRPKLSTHSVSLDYSDLDNCCNPSSLIVFATPSPPTISPSLVPNLSLSQSLSNQPSQFPLFSYGVENPLTLELTLLCCSSHHTGLPAKLNNYVRTIIYSHQSASLLLGPTKGTRYPLANFVFYHQYTPVYQSFVAQISNTTEPRSYLEVVAHPEWQEVIRSELHVL